MNYSEIRDMALDGRNDYGPLYGQPGENLTQI